MKNTSHKFALHKNMCHNTKMSDPKLKVQLKLAYTAVSKKPTKIIFDPVDLVGESIVAAARIHVDRDIKASQENMDEFLDLMMEYKGIKKQAGLNNLNPEDMARKYLMLSKTKSVHPEDTHHFFDLGT